MTLRLESTSCRLTDRAAAGTFQGLFPLQKSRRRTAARVRLVGSLLGMGGRLRRLSFFPRKGSGALSFRPPAQGCSPLLRVGGRKLARIAGAAVGRAPPAARLL